MQHTSYDIAIIGGGNVGLTLACALAQQTRLSIVILEAQPEPPVWQADTYHHRVSAIALSSQRIFKALDVWAGIKNRRISTFDKIAVWDGCSAAQIEFSSQDIAEPLLGYIIENNAVQQALLEKVQQYSQITYLPGKTLTDYRADESHAELTTSDGMQIHCRLAVAADGARSWLRHQAGIICDRQDYQQSAIVASVKTSQPHERTARQVFLETGPLAFLPLADEQWCSIVWSLPDELARAYMALDDMTFKERLGAAFPHLGVIDMIEQRHAFPLAKQQAAKYIANRLALVGDAAHIVHPLAGQGVNMGLLDAASLAELVIAADKNRRDIGGVSVLRKYERWRKGDNQLMFSGVDCIKQLFASDNAAIQRARSMGLTATNQSTVIKNLFIRHAVGNRSGLPELASGAIS